MFQNLPAKMVTASLLFSLVVGVSLRSTNLWEVEAFTDSRYEIVQEVVSKEHFNRLLPIHQHMLVTIMEKAK
ncbi:MAG: hypothetical protein ACI97A_004134, partial [Planctomycetota bacterium]